MRKTAIAAIIAIGASASAFAQIDLTQDFSVSESRSGGFVNVDYIAKKEITRRDEAKTLVAVVKDACKREDVQQGKYPTVNALFGKKAVSVAVNAESCGS